MNAIVVDLTHGGVKISIELKKLGYFKEVHGFDIYKTLKNKDRNLLKSNNIKLIENIKVFEEKLNNGKLLSYKELKEYINKNSHENNGKRENTGNKTKDNLIVISPVHCYLKDEKYLTHHESIELILNKWKKEVKKEKIPIIEVTGVKGKTSTVSMLKEILINLDPIVLSSLGSYLYKNKEEIILKKNISITPGSILETINLAKKLDNTQYNNNNNLKYVNKFNYKSCIFENSLGTNGIGNIGILTNIVENYPIAKGASNAKEGKEQVFKCDIVVGEYKTLTKYYKNKTIKERDKINIFSLDKVDPILNQKKCLIVNLRLIDVEYGLDRTKLKIEFKDIKTIRGNKISGSLSIETFAPGKHHVLNVLATITTALALEISFNDIKEGLYNFRGIKGRTSQKKKQNYRIIEEINPGINVKTIENSINMINNLNNYYIIVGGRYGVTCEEISEKNVAKLLDRLDEINIILTDELGYGIKKKMKKEIIFIEDPIEAQKTAIENGKNILFIYRSNYSQLNKR